MTEPFVRGSTDPVDVLVVGRTEWVAPLTESLTASTDGLRARSVASADEALARLREGGVGGVVTAHELADSTGIDLLRAVRAGFPDLPVVVCTGRGDEALASDAIAAGATDYVPIRSPPAPEDRVRDRVERAIEAGDRAAARRANARRFDAVFDDQETYAWTLAPTGRVTRVNRTALDAIGADEESVLGRAFWTGPWWPTAGDARTVVREAVERGADGERVRREVEVAGGDDRATLDLSIRPVRDDEGTVVSLVADGADITERARLERELRESEELHRVTLNNMTDTVLITDDEGAFTYVCPNVHFIFGYSAEELYELGTIDALLGAALFDREELDAAGVLTNVECRATDKAGRDHTLLVNVRRVDIQGGTTLYSCRDVTKRKQREEALTALHRTARELLYAETDREIGRVVVEDAAAVLDLEASAVFLFDTAENVLRPAAYSTDMEALNGPLSTHRAGEDSITGYAFVEGEPLFFDDVHESERLANPATGVRSAAVIPLGDHGVFVSGSSAVGHFDAVMRELADLLAATTEAALDRVERESTLRTQERELTRQNRQLTRLDRVNEMIREIDQALVQAETRDEIERAACERLTRGDRFSFAWIGAVDPGERELRPRAWTGDEQGYLDSTPFVLDEEAGEPSCRTAATREATAVSNVAVGLRSEPWRKAALSRDYQSVVSVPLAYDEFMYGVLTVYATRPSAFDELSQSVLAELGETIASAISAVERKNALLTTSSVRLEFDVDDPTFVLLRLARSAGCSLSFGGGVQRTADGVHIVAAVEGAALDGVVAAARELVSVESVRVISESADGGMIRLHISQPFIALNLADHGAVLRSASADGTAARIVVDVPSSVNVRRVTQIVSAAFSNAEFVARQELDVPSIRTLRSGFLDRLTERQLEVIQAAYYAGFFESPRERNGKEIAEALDISPPAFYKHMRTIQRKLFLGLFDERGAPVNDSTTG